MGKPKNPAKGAPPTPINEGVAENAPPVLQPTDEQRAAAMVKQQRRLTEHAILQQRFAQVEVAKCIAEAERDQLIQTNQQLNQQLIAARSELDGLKNPTKPVAGDTLDTQPDEGDGQEE